MCRRGGFVRGEEFCQSGMARDTRGVVLQHSPDIFFELVKNAEVVLRRSAGEEKRRQVCMAHDGDEEHDGAVAADDPGVDALGSRADVCGCDLDCVEGVY